MFVLLCLLFSGAPLSGRKCRPFPRTSQVLASREAWVEEEVDISPKVTLASAFQNAVLVQLTGWWRMEIVRLFSTTCVILGEISN